MISWKVLEGRCQLEACTPRKVATVIATGKRNIHPWRLDFTIGPIRG